MNVLGKPKRSWRKARKRGVSPIIATILLVAITVVLAAVLYVLISGLTHGVGSAQLSTAFGWDPSVNDTGTATTGCTTGHYCYSIEVLTASSLTTAAMTFALHTAVGGPAGFPSGTAISLVTSSNAVAATYSTTTNTWSASNVAVTAAEYVVTDSGVTTTHTNGLLGLVFVAVGSGSFSGSVPASAFS